MTTADLSRQPLIRMLIACLVFSILLYVRLIHAKLSISVGESVNLLGLVKEHADLDYTGKAGGGWDPLKASEIPVAVVEEKVPASPYSSSGLLQTVSTIPSVGPGMLVPATAAAIPATGAVATTGLQQGQTLSLVPSALGVPGYAPLGSSPTALTTYAPGMMPGAMPGGMPGVMPYGSSAYGMGGTGAGGYGMGGMGGGMGGYGSSGYGSSGSGYGSSGSGYGSSGYGGGSGYSSDMNYRKRSFIPQDSTPPSDDPTLTASNTTDPQVPVLQKPKSTSRHLRKRQNGYGPGGFSQGGGGFGGSSDGNFAGSGMNGGGGAPYSPSSNSQTGMGQGGFSQTGMGQNGMSQTGMGQGGFGQAGMGQGGMSQTGLGSSGMSSSGMGSSGMSSPGGYDSTGGSSMYGSDPSLADDQSMGGGGGYGQGGSSSQGYNGQSGNYGQSSSRGQGLNGPSLMTGSSSNGYGSSGYGSSSSPMDAGSGGGGGYADPSLSGGNGAMDNTGSQGINGGSQSMYGGSQGMNGGSRSPISNNGGSGVSGIGAGGASNYLSNGLDPTMSSASSRSLNGNSGQFAGNNQGMYTSNQGGPGFNTPGGLSTSGGGFGNGLQNTGLNVANQSPNSLAGSSAMDQGASASNAAYDNSGGQSQGSNLNGPGSFGNGGMAGSTNPSVAGTTKSDINTATGSGGSANNLGTGAGSTTMGNTPNTALDASADPNLSGSAAGAAGYNGDPTSGATSGKNSGSNLDGGAESEASNQVDDSASLPSTIDSTTPLTSSPATDKHSKHIIIKTTTNFDYDPATGQYTAITETQNKGNTSTDAKSTANGEASSSSNNASLDDSASASDGTQGGASADSTDTSTISSNNDGTNTGRQSTPDTNTRNSGNTGNGNLLNNQLQSQLIAHRKAQVAKSSPSSPPLGRRSLRLGKRDLIGGNTAASYDPTYDSTSNMPSSQHFHKRQLGAILEGLAVAGRSLGVVGRKAATSVAEEAASVASKVPKAAEATNIFRTESAMAKGGARMPRPQWWSSAKVRPFPAETMARDPPPSVHFPSEFGPGPIRNRPGLHRVQSMPNMRPGAPPLMEAGMMLGPGGMLPVAERIPPGSPMLSRPPSPEPPGLGPGNRPPGAPVRPPPNTHEPVTAYPPGPPPLGYPPQVPYAASNLPAPARPGFGALAGGGGPPVNLDALQKSQSLNQKWKYAAGGTALGMVADAQVRQGQMPLSTLQGISMIPGAGFNGGMMNNPMMQGGMSGGGMNGMGMPLGGGGMSGYGGGGMGGTGGMGGYGYRKAKRDYIPADKVGQDRTRSQKRSASPLLDKSSGHQIPPAAEIAGRTQSRQAKQVRRQQGRLAKRREENPPYWEPTPFNPLAEEASQQSNPRPSGSGRYPFKRYSPYPIPTKKPLNKMFWRPASVPPAGTSNLDRFNEAIRRLRSKEYQESYLQRLRKQAVSTEGPVNGPEFPTWQPAGPRVVPEPPLTRQAPVNEDATASAKADFEPEAPKPSGKVPFSSRLPGWLLRLMKRFHLTPEAALNFIVEHSDTACSMVGIPAPVCSFVKKKAQSAVPYFTNRFFPMPA